MYLQPCVFVVVEGSEFISDRWIIFYDILEVEIPNNVDEVQSLVESVARECKVAIRRRCVTRQQAEKVRDELHKAYLTSGVD